VSDVAFGVGLVGIAAGVVILLVEQDKPLRVGHSRFAWQGRF